jgi:hypothetical protein
LSIDTPTRSEIKFPDRRECSELLERIVSSAEFRRAARLREFLSYVGQRCLNSDNILISEHEIGVHVFGRTENYDTSADNIVRVNASEIRKRIAAYFASEGAHEAVLIEIPRGSYTPQFRFRPAEPEPQIDISELASDSGISESDGLSSASFSSPAVTWRWIFLLLTLVLALAVACSYFWYQNRDIHQKLYAWKSEPALGPFWSNILGSSRQTDVVLADTSFALVEDILKKHISLNDYLNRDYIQQIQHSDLSPELKDDLQIVASRSNGSLGDFRVAQKILGFDPLSSRTHLQFARDYRPSAIKTDNVILIGSSRSNPWTGLFEDRLNFTLEYDAGLKEMLVRNRRPQPGEEATYVAPVDPNGSNGYSVISYIQNQNHSADVLIVAGTTSEATEAAGDFLTSEEPLRRFRDRLHVRTLPYFEVLLKTTKLVGTPLSAEVIAYRTLSENSLNLPK